MSQPLVLAIEPDLRQAAIVKRIVREQALADVLVVDSRDAAVEAIRTRMPDVLLLSTLLSPRDEDELISHLRTLDSAGHLQTHTIPQLASTLGGAEEERSSRGLLSAFRRKKEAAPVAGCDPDLFADEIRVYLQQAADKKNQIRTMPFVDPSRRMAAAAAPTAPADAEESAAPASSWASPFEWKPSTSPSQSRAREASPAPQRVPAPEPVVAPPIEPLPEPVSVAPAFDAPSVIKPLEEPIAALPVVREAAHEPAIVAPVVAPAPEPPPVEIAPPAPVSRKAAKPVEAPRPKAVSDRPAKISRAQLQEMLKAQKTPEGSGRDRLGPLTRWARSDSPRGTKTGVAQSDDFRALISSLAVPSSVASVAYARGVRIRRVRVPLSPDHDAAVQASA